VAESPRSLWRHDDFVKLWIAETISQVGSQVTLLALPLVAIDVLQASTFQVALLGTIELLPFVLLGLPAGVWIDRRHRRPILLMGDLGRAVALGSIPIAYYFDALSLLQLYVVAFVVGSFTVAFDVAYEAYLPSLVEREQLVEGYSKLEISRSGATIAGPTIAGSLVASARTWSRPPRPAASSRTCGAVSEKGSAMSSATRTCEPSPRARRPRICS
jgi:MFS family permease